jgi:hypothetical protein
LGELIGEYAGSTEEEGSRNRGLNSSPCVVTKEKKVTTKRRERAINGPLSMFGENENSGYGLI